MVEILGEKFCELWISHTIMSEWDPLFSTELTVPGVTDADLLVSFRDSLHNLVMYTFMQHLIQQDSRLKNNQTKGRKKLETSKEKRKKKHGKTSAFL